MKAVVAAFLAVGLAAATLANAAEPGASFRGPYIGLNAGVARGSAGLKTDPGCSPDNGTFCNFSQPESLINGTVVGDSGTKDIVSTGFTGGVQGGFNERRGGLVFGVEADFGLLDLGASETAAGLFPFTFLGDRYELRQTMSTDWLATLRGRVGGVVTPKLLLYATGGLALTELEVTTRYSDNAIDATFPGGAGAGSDSSLRLGWTIGAGGEWLLDGPWSFKAEYLFTRFGSKSFDVPTSNTVDFQQTMRVKADLDVHILRIGLNYRF